MTLATSLLPIPQGPRGDGHTLGCVRAGDAESCRAVVEVEDHVAGLVFSLTAR